MTMRSDDSILYLNTFGRVEIIYKGKNILAGKYSLTKTMSLLVILLFFGEQGVPRNFLLDELYEHKDSDDAANSLRVTVHRLRKFIQDCGFPSDTHISTVGGVHISSLLR